MNGNSLVIFRAAEIVEVDLVERPLTDGNEQLLASVPDHGDSGATPEAPGAPVDPTETLTPAQRAEPTASDGSDTRLSGQ